MFKNVVSHNQNSLQAINAYLVTNVDFIYYINYYVYKIARLKPASDCGYGTNDNNELELQNLILDHHYYLFVEVDKTKPVGRCTREIVII